MFEKGDRIVIAEGHEHAGREGEFLYWGTTPFTAGRGRVKLDRLRKNGTTTSLFADEKFISMAKKPTGVTAQIQEAAAAPEAAPSRKKEKVKHTFGKGTEVRVTNGASPFHEMVGKIVTGVLNDQDHCYDVRFLFPTGMQRIHVNDLDLEEDLNEVAAPPVQATSFTHEPSREIHLSRITPDIQQPRKHFEEDAQQELADSIKEHGVLQAIVVRPNPYLISKDEAQYCIVFGERRYRAALLAGLETIPAIVRQLTDMQALELQIVENLQRKDVHPMEEGLAFKRLLEGGSDIEALRHKIGVSARYVATRIKLSDLIQQWQEAYLKDRIDLGQAVKLSKLDDKTQGMLYRDGIKNTRSDEGRMNLWNLDEAVRTSNHSLDKASFKTEDASLNPEMGACSTCAFNTSNTPRLFLGDERICTNSACYSIKEKNSYKKKLEKAAKDPEVIFLDNSHYLGNEEKKKIEAVKEMGVQLVSRGDIITAAKDPGPKPEWETFLAERKKEYEEDFEEGDDPIDEKDIKDEYDEQVEEWDEEKADYEKSQQPGATRKAFVVTGNDAGKYINVILKSEHPEADGKGGTSSIADIEKREARAKELDNEKVYKQIVPLIKDLDTFIDSTQPLSKAETCALAMFIRDASPYTTRDWFDKQFDRKDAGRYNDGALHSQLMEELLPGTMNQFIRRAIRERLITSSDLDYGHNGKAAAIMGIARQYLPTEVSEIELQQQEKAIKRTKRVEERLAELRKPAEQPAAPAPELLKIRSENGRNIIKVQNPDSSQAWRKLEGPFADNGAMETRFQALLATGQYVQG